MCELLFLATIAAFLAFMALKVPDTEKLLTFHIFDPLAFKSTFVAFAGLFKVL